MGRFNYSMRGLTAIEHRYQRMRSENLVPPWLPMGYTCIIARFITGSQCTVVNPNRPNVIRGARYNFLRDLLAPMRLSVAVGFSGAELFTCQIQYLRYMSNNIRHMRPGYYWPQHDKVISKVASCGNTNGHSLNYAISYAAGILYYTLYVYTTLRRKIIFLSFLNLNRRRAGEFDTGLLSLFVPTVRYASNSVFAARRKYFARYFFPYPITCIHLCVWALIF